MRSSDALARVARLLKIVLLVRSRSSWLPLGRAALAEACGCTERTVQRDIALLLEAGIPLFFDTARRAYTLPEKSHWVFPVVTLTPEDALTLALAQVVLSGTGVPHQQSILHTLDKLTGTMPPVLQSLYVKTAASVQAGPPVRDYSQAPLTALMEAVQAEETVEIDYQSQRSGERRRRHVDPYLVTARDGQFWELHGWCHVRQQVLTFALDSIHDATATSTRFVKRAVEWEAFQRASGVVGGLRGGPSVDVRAVFDRKVATYALRRQWPDGLRVTAQDDGTACLTGLAQGTEGLVVELLRWRRHLRVEGGAELLAAMQQEVQAMAALYAK